jgi:hypothetical protein
MLVSLTTLAIVEKDMRTARDKVCGEPSRISDCQLQRLNLERHRLWVAPFWCRADENDSGKHSG